MFRHSHAARRQLFRHTRSRSIQQKGKTRFAQHLRRIGDRHARHIRHGHRGNFLFLLYLRRKPQVFKRLGEHFFGIGRGGGGTIIRPLRGLVHDE